MLNAQCLVAPLRSVEPTEVRLDHLHAVISRCFDTNDHDPQMKPYAISPAARTEFGAVGTGIATLTGVAEIRFQQETSTARRVRLGGRLGTLLPPRRLRSES